jgi:hypothetical protein
VDGAEVLRKIKEPRHGGTRPPTRRIFDLLALFCPGIFFFWLGRVNEQSRGKSTSPCRPLETILELAIRISIRIVADGSSARNVGFGRPNQPVD